MLNWEGSCQEPLESLPLNIDTTNNETICLIVCNVELPCIWGVLLCGGLFCKNPGYCPRKLPCSWTSPVLVPAVLKWSDCSCWVVVCVGQTEINESGLFF